MCTNNHVVAAERLAELVEVNSVGLESVWLNGTGRGILHRCWLASGTLMARCEATYGTSVANTVWADNTETQLEEVWDLVSPCHRQVRESMDLDRCQYNTPDGNAIARMEAWGVPGKRYQEQSACKTSFRFSNKVAFSDAVSMASDGARL